MMIPFHTILALLAALVMMSCSQEPPPGGRANGQRGNNKNVTSLVSPTPSPSIAPNVITKDPSVYVKPDKDGVPQVSPDSTVIALRSSNVNELKVWVLGRDAQRLYAMLEIQPRYEKIQYGSLRSDSEDEAVAKGYVKTGQSIQCRQSGLPLYDCWLTIKLQDGELNELSELKEIKSNLKYASFRTDEKMIGHFINFSANPMKGEVSSAPFFQINLLKAEARQLHSALQVGDIEGRKRGKRVNCTRNLTMDPQADDAYGCIFYGNLSTGSFEEIK